MLRRIFLVGVALSLSGCYPKVASVSMNSERVVQLERFHVTTYVVPSDAIVDPITGRKSQDFEATLEPMLTFAKAHKDLHISIIAYGNAVLPSGYATQLYRFQSETLASLFWKHGIDSKRLHFSGEQAGTNPSEVSPGQARDERRVEISFFKPK